MWCKYVFVFYTMGKERGLEEYNILETSLKGKCGAIHSNGT